MTISDPKARKEVVQSMGVRYGDFLGGGLFTMLLGVAVRPAGMPPARSLRW
jgi:hypothetical protein